MTTGGRLSAKSASTSPITTPTANTPASVTSHQTNSNSPSPLQTKPSACPSNRQHLSLSYDHARDVSSPPSAALGCPWRDLLCHGMPGRQHSCSRLAEYP